MITSLKEQLIRDEGGYQAFMYLDSVGVPTIGVGRNIKTKGLSILEMDIMLTNDIAEFTLAVCTAIPWWSELNAVRQEVLINMAFNLGVVGLLGFVKFLAALKAKNYPLAAKEMLDSKWAKQVGGRATRLSQQILLGVRQ